MVRRALGGRTPSGTASTAAVLGVLVSWYGFHWDIATHVDLGRDRFLSLPHLLIIAGFWLSTGAALCSLLYTRAPLSRSWRDRPGMGLILGSGIIGLANLLFDNWWHLSFGLDGAVWSPPHLLLGFVGVAAVVGALLDRRRSGLTAAWVVGACAVLLTSLSVLLSGYEYGYPHFRVLWWIPALALLAGFCLALGRSASRLRWAATALVAVMLGLRLLGSLANGALDRSAPTLPVALLAVAVTADLLQVGTGTRLRRQTVQAAVAWLSAVPAIVAWYQWFGPVELPAAIWVPAASLATVTWLGGVALGTFVGRRLATSGPGHVPLAPGRGNRVGAALVVSLLIAVPVIASAAPQLGGLPAIAVAAHLQRDGERLVLTVASAQPGDVVTVVGPREAGCLPEACIRGRKYVGRLEQQRPGRFGGAIEQPGDYFVLWYVGGDHVWATVVDRSEVGPLQLEPVALPSDTSTQDLVVAGLGVVAIIAVVVTSIERRLRPTGLALSVGAPVLASASSDEKRGLP